MLQVHKTLILFHEKGSAFYAPAASGVKMAEAYLNDEKKLLPCAIQLNGEYGVNNVYAGVPVIIGKNGVEKIEQIDLDEKEKKEFMHKFFFFFFIQINLFYLFNTILSNNHWNTSVNIINTILSIKLNSTW